MGQKKSDSIGAKSFEESLARLEEILEAMNSGTLSLDESLKIFEEADKLLTGCNTRLNEAEKKIEQLVKSRSGELQIDDEGRPITQGFEGDL